MSSELSLLQMPDVALNEIVKKCDYISTQTLRKVCRDLRKFIEGVKPDYHFINVFIQLDPHSLYLVLNESDDEGKKITIRYSQHGLNCYVSLTKPSGKNSEHLLNTNFLDCFCRDFAIALSSQKSIIQQFTLCHLADLSAKYALDLLRKLKSGNWLLKVRSVVLSTIMSSMIVNFLQILDPNYLETIKIVGHRTAMTSTDMNRIRELEQFKNAKELELLTGSISCPVEYFSHFEKVRVMCESVTEEMLISLKQMFITSSNLSSFSIQLSRYCDRYLISSCFGRPDEQLSSQYTDKWILMIPGSEDVILVERSPAHVKFERKKNNR